MSRKSKGIALTAAITALIASSGVTAGVLFEDGFESGATNFVSNAVRYVSATDSTKVSSTLAKTGKYSLEFLFAGKPAGQDAWAEERLSLGGQRTEIWVKYDLYVPSNYYHRNDGASNNKFFAIYSSPYTAPGFQVNFSTQPSNGNSSLGIHFYKNGVEQSPAGFPSGEIIGSSDRGKWMRVVMHFKVPTSQSSSDGVMEIWKNGSSVVSIKNLPSNATSGKNYMDEAYILGWANSGFSADTRMYVDDIVVSTSPISLAGTDAPAMAPPQAPVLNISK